MSKYRSLESTIRNRRTIVEKAKIEKDMNDQVFAGTYRSKHFEASPDAQRIYFSISKEIDPVKVERSVKTHDELFGLAKKVQVAGYATDQDKQAADDIVNRLKAVVSEFEIPIDHSHVDKIHKQIVSKVGKQPPDIIDDPNATFDQVKNRFSSLPKQEQPEVGIGNDVDIDQKIKTPQRTSAIAKQRYLNVSIGETMSLKTLPKGLIETVTKILNEKTTMPSVKATKAAQRKFAKQEERPDLLNPTRLRAGTVRTMAGVRKGKPDAVKAAKQLGLTSEAAKPARPDFPDVDGDGNRTELLKTALKQKQRGKVQEARGVADQQVDPHNCATHVFHEQHGFGRPIHGQHADPDSDGNIEWYDVKFDDGKIVEGVMTSDMEVLVSEMHGGMGHKRGKKKRGMKESADYHPSGTGFSHHPVNQHTVRDPKTKLAYASFVGPNAKKLAADFAKDTGGEYVPPENPSSNK